MSATMLLGDALTAAIKRASESHARLVNVHRNSLPSTSAKKREQRAQSVADALIYLRSLEEARERVLELRDAAVKFAALLQPEAVHAHQAKLPDNQGVYGINGVTITLGDLRRIKAAVDALGVL